MKLSAFTGEGPFCCAFIRPTTLLPWLLSVTSDKRPLHWGDEQQISEITCIQARHLNWKQLVIYKKEGRKIMDNILLCRKWKSLDFTFLSWKWRLWSIWQREGSALKTERRKVRYRLCCYYVNTACCLLQYFSFRSSVVARNISNLFFLPNAGRELSSIDPLWQIQCARMNPHTVKGFDLLSRKTVFLYSTHVKSTIFGEIGRILLRVYRILSYHKRRWLMEVGGKGKRQILGV